MKYVIDARGKQCPLPVVMAKKVLDEALAGDEAEIYVDNEIAVNNLGRLAKSQGCSFVSKKVSAQHYIVRVCVGENARLRETPELENCACEGNGGLVAAVTSDKMGEGDDELGRLLMKSFFFAVTQLNLLPKTMLFYNGGAKLTAEGSPCLEDIRRLEEEGVEILTCGTCLNYYGLTEKLCVGSVTNMYTIVETLAKAGKIMRP